jgi:hypothetical protein
MAATPFAEAFSEFATKAEIDIATQDFVIRLGGIIVIVASVMLAAIHYMLPLHP